MHKGKITLGGIDIRDIPYDELSVVEPFYEVCIETLFLQFVVYQ